MTRNVRSSYHFMMPHAGSWKESTVTGTTRSCTRSPAASSTQSTSTSSTTSSFPLSSGQQGNKLVEISCGLGGCRFLLTFCCSSSCLLWVAGLPWESNLWDKRFFPHISLPLFSSLVYIFHGERDLSSLPCLGGAAVQISLKREECCVAVAIYWGMTQYWSENLLPHKLDPHWSVSSPQWASLAPESHGENVLRSMHSM